jgi:hypothetical protein
LTLQATINLPTANDDPHDHTGGQINGFISMVNLFRPFDDAFLGTWNKTRGQLSAQYLSNLQKQLSDLVRSYMCQDANVTDLHTNQHWLKNTVWQLTNGHVGGDKSMPFQYPANMSRELLVTMASQFNTQANDILSAGLVCSHFLEVLWVIC